MQKLLVLLPSLLLMVASITVLVTLLVLGPRLLAALGQ